LASYKFSIIEVDRKIDALKSVRIFFISFHCDRIFLASSTRLVWNVMYFHQDFPVVDRLGRAARFLA